MKEFIRHHKLLLLFSGIVLLILGWGIICGGMAVRHYVAGFNKTYGPKEEPEGEVNFYRVPGYHELLKKKGELEGLVKLAKNDSIGLFLNLPDSVVQLMIKGVAVRDIPLREIQLSALFKEASQEALYEWLSEPVKVERARATIDREPVNVVQAPKDSSDVIPAVQPDTSNSQPVFFILETDRNLKLYFYEIENDRTEAFHFRFPDSWEKAKDLLKAMYTFSIPSYVPEIQLGVTREDAKVLFRALPVHGLIVVTL